jgi:GDP-L-fucose synthase
MLGDESAKVIYQLAGKRVYVAGHRGMLGSAVVRRLEGEGCEVLTVARERLDLSDQAAVRRWMAKEKPDASRKIWRRPASSMRL